MIYGMVANVSIGQLFLAGIMPGLVMTVLMMLTVAYFAHKNNWGARHQVRVDAASARRCSSSAIVIAFPLGDLGRGRRLGVDCGRRDAASRSSLLFVADWNFKFEAVLPIMTPVLLIGGMTTGIFTPTEGAVAASIWALFLGLVWYRTLSLADARSRSRWTRSRPRPSVLFIVAAASIFGWLLTATRVTDMVDGVGARRSPTSRGCSCCWRTCCCCSSAASSSRPRRS